MESIKVVTLGASGFIGKRLYENFLKDGITVEGFSSSQVDLLSEKSSRKLLKILDMRTTVIMASAITRDRADDLDSMIKNIVMVTNLARQLRETKINHLIFISSFEVYGNKSILPITEKTKIDPANFYGISKVAGEFTLKKVCEEEGILLTILRFGGIYGEGDTHKSPINLFVNWVLAGEPVCIFGDGSDLRNYVYVGDVYEVVKEVTLKKITGTYNVANDKSVPIVEIVNIIYNLSNKKIPKNVHNVERKTDKHDLVLNISHFKKSFPNIKMTSLKEGLRKTIKNKISKK